MLDALQGGSFAVEVAEFTGMMVLQFYAHYIPASHVVVTVAGKKDIIAVRFCCFAYSYGIVVQLRSYLYACNTPQI